MGFHFLQYECAGEIPGKLKQEMMTSKLKARFDRLDQDLESLISELEEVPESILEQQPAADQWSALQTMFHLAEAERFSHQYLQKKLQPGVELPKGGLGAAFRSTLLSVYLSLPFKFKSPAAVDALKAQDKQLGFRETVDRWRKQRQQLRHFIEELPQEVFDKAAYRHPFAGRLTLGGMLNFFDTHFRRHREQIRRAITSVQGK